MKKLKALLVLLTVVGFTLPMIAEAAQRKPAKSHQTQGKKKKKRTKAGGKKKKKKHSAASQEAAPESSDGAIQ